MNEAMRGLLFNERFFSTEPPDYDFPSCGAADEYGHPIPCEACIWGDSCLDSTCRVDEDEEESEPDVLGQDEPSGQSLTPCLHRFEINEPACRVCSGLPRGVCVLYAP